MHLILLERPLVDGSIRKEERAKAMVFVGDKLTLRRERVGNVLRHGR